MQYDNDPSSSSSSSSSSSMMTTTTTTFLPVEREYKAHPLVQLPLVLRDMYHPDDEQRRYKALVRICELLSTASADPPIDEIVQVNLIPVLVRLMNGDNNDTIFHAAIALTNICTGQISQTLHVVRAGAVKVFIKLLMSSPEMRIRHQAVWALRNISLDSPAMRALIVAENGIHALLVNIDIQQQQQHPLLKEGLEFQRWIMRALANLCRPNPPHEDTKFALPALPTLLSLMQSSFDTTIITLSAWGIAFITDSAEPILNDVDIAAIVHQLINMLENSGTQDNPETAALRIIGNITCFIIKREVLNLFFGNPHFLDRIHKQLSSNNATASGGACRAIAGLMTGHADLVEVVWRHGRIFPRIIEIAKNGALMSFRAQAVTALCDAMRWGPIVCVADLIANDAVVALCNYLDSPDPITVKCILSTFADLLARDHDYHLKSGNPNPFAACIEHAGGLRKLEDLQEHKDTGVYIAALNILETYFPNPDDELIIHPTHKWQAEYDDQQAQEQRCIPQSSMQLE